MSNFQATYHAPKTPPGRPKAQKTWTIIMIQVGRLVARRYAATHDITPSEVAIAVSTAMAV